MGGTIKKLAKKRNKLRLCVISEGASAQYQDRRMIEIRRNSCIKSGKLLGISDFDFLEFPDMRLDSVPHLEINKKLEKIVMQFKPSIVYTTPYNDLNKDHQVVFDCTLVATRPLSSSVKQILCYELPGQVKTQFIPNIYEDITKEMSAKITAFKKYKSEVGKFPHQRSIKSIENLAVHRGVEAGLKCAEAFHLIRKIED